MPNAAIYARYSTDLQRDRSIEDQIELCRGYAAREGLSVVETYSDRAQSGASMVGRDGIWQMLAAAQAGRFNTIIVEELDRLSRDIEDLAGVVKRLRFAGVDVLSVHSGRADTIQVGIRGLLGEMFLTDLKHKVRRGLAGVVRDGRSAGGKAYGYKPVPGQPGLLAIDEAEAAIVRRIHAEYLSGASPRAICGQLNAEATPAPRGATWNASTLNGNGTRVCGILTNPLYDGRRAWNRLTMVRDPETGKRVSRPNKQADWQWHEDESLRIVDRETFAAVQRRKAALSHGGGERDAHKHIGLLSGLMKCAKCGGGMVSIGRSRPGQPVRLQCSRIRESGSCAARGAVARGRVEEVVLAGLKLQLSDRRAVALYVKTYNEEMAALRADATNQRQRFEVDRSKAEATLARIQRLAVAGVLNEEEAAHQVSEQRGAIEAATIALASLDAPTVISINPSIVQTYLDTISRLGEEITRSPEAVALIRDSITKITICTEKGEIYVQASAALCGGDSGSGGAFRSSSPRVPIVFTRKIA